MSILVTLFIPIVTLGVVAIVVATLFGIIEFFVGGLAGRGLKNGKRNIH